MNLLAALITFFALVPLFSLPNEDPLPRVGSAYCNRCHSAEFSAMQDNPDKKSCESCHGNGVRHALAPTKSNIVKTNHPKFSHAGKGGALKNAPQEKLKIDLFVMSLCPYGIEAEHTLMPVIKKWQSHIDFHLYHIAHERNQPKTTPAPALDKTFSSGKCETDGAELDGTDRFVSLHGLPEVVEGLRQCALGTLFPKRLPNYLLERNRQLKKEWKSAATAAGLTKQEIEQVSDLTGSIKGDSLFAVNIAEAALRKVSGSPTLFINGREWPEAISSYALERTLCQDKKRDSVACVGTPECGIDSDCKRVGFESKCTNPGTAKAKCSFTPATAITVTVVNDTGCPDCHTGNILREIMSRFPAAAFRFLDLKNDTAKSLIKKYQLTAYPSFLFSAAAEQSSTFKAIERTFRKKEDRFILENRITQSYHYTNRIEEPYRLTLIGAVEHPPFVETLKELTPLLTDTLKKIPVQLIPFVVANLDAKKNAPWESQFDAPNGPGEIRESARLLCLQASRPLTSVLPYLQCRREQIRERFEKEEEEPENEWLSCALKSNIDTTSLKKCMLTEGKTRLFEAIKTLDSLEIETPDPVFILNNHFRITGYNPLIHARLRKKLLPE